MHRNTINLIDEIKTSETKETKEIKDVKKIIDASPIHFLIKQYQQVSINKKAAAVILYDSVKQLTTDFFQTTKKTLFNSDNSEVKKTREQYCKDFLTYSEITPEKLVQLLLELGNAADDIQQNQSRAKSDFMLYMHGIRDVLLFIIFPHSDSSKEMKFNEYQLFADATLKKQDEFKIALESKIATSCAEQKKQCTEQTAEVYNNEINALRCQLAYLGYLEHLYNVNDRNAIFKPKEYYTSDPKDLLRPFPTILQKNFGATLIRTIHGNHFSNDTLVDKSDEEVIHFLISGALEKKIIKSEMPPLQLPTITHIQNISPLSNSFLNSTFPAPSRKNSKESKESDDPSQKAIEDAIQDSLQDSSTTISSSLTPTK